MKITIYLFLMIVSIFNTGYNMWYDNWPKATFHLIVTLIWCHLITTEYPINNGKALK